ncbi:MAG: protein kinase [Verrucomicrobiae bacterium]|nr:protein kinase [Verrucomicrobiae bacterium]
MEEIPCSEEIPFGRYLLKERIAAGGMGIVYKAEDRTIRRTVALKMVRGSAFANESEVARFTVEAEAAASLDHPNIVPIYEIGLEEDQPFFTMKLIEGENLGYHLRIGDGRVNPRQLARWLSMISRAVHHAHQRGVLHRDLKPGNILIDAEGNPWLTDFGLAKLVHRDSGLTRTSDRLGTPDYMAPEMVDGTGEEVSTACDVWALGVILWQSLYGSLPFKGDRAVETMRKIIEEEPKAPKGDVSRDLLTLACRCLEKDPLRRLSSAAELADELDRWLRGEPLRIRPVTSWERSVKWTRRNPLWAALAVTLLLGGSVSLVLWRRAEHAVESLTVTNTQLNRSLVVAMGTKLATNARLQAQEDSSLALLLAAESAEMTQRATGAVLGESAEALYATLQQVGGMDLSPRGIRAEDEEPGFIDYRAPEEYPLHFSPDGKLVLVMDKLATPHLLAAAYGIGTAERLGEVFKWPLPDGSRAACWLNDSRRLLIIGESAGVVLWRIRGGGQNAGDSPRSRDLGTLAKPGQTLQRAWVSRTADPGKMRALAQYRVEEGAGKTRSSVVLFTIQPDADQPIAELAAFPCPQIPNSEETYWAVSPSLEWTYVKDGPQALLANFHFDEGTMTWTEMPTFDGAGEAFFTPEGRWMVYRTGSGNVARCDLRGGMAEIAGKSSVTLVESEQDIFRFAHSADGKLVAYCDDKSFRLSVMEVGDPSTTVTIRDDSQIWTKLRFSDDGKWLVAGALEKVCYLWPLESSVTKLNQVGTPQQFRGLSTSVLDVVFAPGGESLVAYGTDGHFRHWSLSRTKDCLLPEFLTTGNGSIHDLALSPDGRWCATANSADNRAEPGEVKLIKLGSTKEDVIGRHAGIATGVAVSPDGQWVASSGSDGMAFVWSFPAVTAAIENGEPPPAPVYRFDMTHTRLEFSRRLDFHRSGKLYATCGDGILFEWDLRAADPMASCVEHKVHSISYLLPDVCASPDGKWLAVARHGWDPPEEGGVQSLNMVLLYDLSEPGNMVFHAALPANFLESMSLAFSKDSRWLAAGAAGRGATVWDLAASNIEKSRQESAIFDHELRGVAFSPDGRWLGLGASDSQFHFWNWKTGDYRTIATEKAVRAVGWCSPSQLVTGDAGGTVAVWETDISKLIVLARKTAGRDLTAAESARFGLLQNRRQR